MPTFNATEFVVRLGQDLVRDFERAREQATTSGLKGAAIEKPVRDRLEQVLPRGIAVGSGCVIDSYGRCSKQQDIILYERDICPVFSVNDTPESTYYPCEGVIGVIEVKSTVGSSDLADMFEKVASVRRLQRRKIYSHERDIPDRPEYRYYNRAQLLATSLPLTEPRRIEEAGADQIFGAGIGGSLRMSENAFDTKFRDLLAQHGDGWSPDVIAVLEYGIIKPCAYDGPQPYFQYSFKNASHFALIQDNPFGSLLLLIQQVYKFGVSSPVDAFNQYFVGGDSERVSKLLPK